ncbi:hypothetical protein ACFO1B_49525 [Dactylosporangium siamense]
MNAAPADAAMTLEEAELAYRRLAGIRDRLARKLLTEIESHDGLRHLTDHRLAGHTLRLWRELQADIVLLGTQYQALERHVGTVEALRARGDRSGVARLARLSDLLHSPTVRLRADGTPAGDTTDPVAETITLDALCERVEALGDGIRARLQDVDVAAKAVLTRLGALADALSALAAQPPAHDDLVERYRHLRALALDDPIGWAADERELSGLEADVADARAVLDSTREVARAAGERIDTLRAAIEAVDAAEAHAETTRARASRKVTGGDPEPAAGQGPALRAAVADLERHRTARRWPEVTAGLAAVERAAAAAVAAAADRAAAAQALLDRRDQLRGRLDGYRAKAGRLGIDERTELAAAYRTAREQLWKAPCDLDAAAGAVWRYQDLVATRPRHDGGAKR